MKKTFANWLVRKIEHKNLSGGTDKILGAQRDYHHIAKEI